MLHLALNVLLKNIFKANFTLLLHWCLVFNSFLVFHLWVELRKHYKKSLDKTDVKMWSQNFEKNAWFGVKCSLKEKFV